MSLSIEAWIGIVAIVVAVVGILVGRALIARKSHVQKQTALGGTSVQAGRDVNVRKD